MFLFSDIAELHVQYVERQQQLQGSKNVSCMYTVAFVFVHVKSSIVKILVLGPFILLRIVCTFILCFSSVL